MNRKESLAWRALIVVTALFLAAAAASGDESTDATPPPQAPADGAAAAPRSLVNLSETEAARLAPLARGIRAVLLQERAAVTALAARIAETRDNAENFALQRQIGAVKLQAEIDVMEVQARYAEGAGRTGQAEAIRKALAPLAERAAQLQEIDGVRR